MKIYDSKDRGDLYWWKDEAELCEMVINGMPSDRIEMEEKNTSGRFWLICWGFIVDIKKLGFRW